MSFNKPVLSLKNICKKYYIYDRPIDRLKQFFSFGGEKHFREFEAIKDVSFDIYKGQTVGIIGRNGSGKSTLLQIICKTLQPTSGEIQVNGRISALLELGAGFNPEFTGIENIYLNATILGIPKDELEKKLPDILEFASIGDKVYQPVKNYSSGMYVRLAFAVAIFSNPDILIVDEALAVGDELFQRKCFARIREIQEQGATILFVSHSAQTIMEICNKAILLDAGELLMIDSPKKVITSYHRLLFSGTRPGKEEKSEAIYAEGLAPETTIVYPANGAELSNFRIETIDGEKVNILYTGEEYVYKYDATFTEDLKNIFYGMMIKTMTGLELSGKSNVPSHMAVESGKLGETRTISFQFTCNLQSGTYLLNAGCLTYENGMEIFRARVIDALIFKVINQDFPEMRGIVNIGIK